MVSTLSDLPKNTFLWGDASEVRAVRLKDSGIASSSSSNVKMERTSASMCVVESKIGVGQRAQMQESWLCILSRLRKEHRVNEDVVVIEYKL